MYKSQKKIGPAAPQSFKSFEKLPAEIRLKIWEPLATEPRVVEVLSTVFEHKEHCRITFSSITPVLAVLHVNCESRTLGLKYYSLYFSTPSDIIHGGKNTIYLNPRVNTVFLVFPAPSDLLYLYDLDNINDSRALVRVQKVAIPYEVMPATTSAADYLSRFSKLKEVIIVVNRIVEEESENDEDDYLGQNDEISVLQPKLVGHCGKALIFQDLPEDDTMYRKTTIEHLS